MDDEGVKQWPEWYPNEAIFIQDITKNYLFVSEENQHIIGLIVLSPECPEEYGQVKWKSSLEKVNSVHRLAVHPKFKTPELAKELMNHVEEVARQQGFELIRLDTYSKNTIANRFYQKLAYQFCGDINLQYMPEKYHCYEKVL